MPAPDFDAIIARSRGVADKMSKGIQYLFKKNNITVIEGHGKLTADKTVEVTNAAGEKTIFEAQHIVLATAPSRQLPNIPQDGKRIIGYRQALTLDHKPESMIVVGSGQSVPNWHTSTMQWVPKYCWLNSCRPSCRLKTRKYPNK